jgi:hypothetical protein
MASKFLLEPFVTTSVTPDITWIIIQFMFHIRFVFIYTTLNLISFLLCFA